MRITNPPPGHDSLGGVSTSDHHTKYSDADAVSAVVEDAAYGAGWNADTAHAPSQNAVYDAIEALHAAPSDTAYANTWNGVTDIAPSKNAIYDKIEALHAAPSDTAYANTWNAVTDIAPSKNAIYDKIEALALGACVHISTVVSDGDATVELTGLDTSLYSRFLVCVSNWQTGSNGLWHLIMDNDGTYDTSANYWTVFYNTTSAHTTAYSWNTGNIGLAQYSASPFSVTFMIHTGEPNSYTMVEGTGVGQKDGVPYGVRIYGYQETTLTLTKLKFTAPGTTTAGTFSVWGLRGS